MLLQRLSHCTKGRLRCTAAAEPCQPFRPAQHGRSTRAECCGCGNFLSSSAPFGQKKRLRFAGGPPDWRRAPFNAGEGMPEARRNRHNRHTTQQTQRNKTHNTKQRNTTQPNSQDKAAECNTQQHKRNGTLQHHNNTARRKPLQHKIKGAVAEAVACK